MVGTPAGSPAFGGGTPGGAPHPPSGGGGCGGDDAGGGASAGLLLHWLPSTCTLVAAGGAPYARLWDLGAQRAAGLLHLGAAGGGAAITCLSSAWPGASIVVAGTSSGALHVLDTRLAGGAVAGAPGAPAGGARSAVVLSLREHRSYVVAVSHARAQSAFSMVSGSVAADVRAWDLRVPRCVTALAAHSRGFMTAFAQHDYAPLWATGSSGQQARVFTNAGEPLADVRFHEGFAGQRIGQVSALAWHPNKLMLAVGAADSYVDILAA
jgi:WD40 repeat protein